MARLPFLRLYWSFPPCLRNMATTVYAALTHRRRFGKDFHQFLKTLETTQWKPTDVLLNNSRQAAMRFFQDWNDVICQWYKEGSLHLTWEEVPILTKHQVRQLGKALWNLAISRDVVLLHTSGTTGSPVTVPSTRAALQRENAFAWQHRSWHDCSLGCRTATIAGHPVVSPAQKDPPFWSYNRLHRQLLFSSYHISPQTAKYYIEALCDFQPELIHGYPSSISLLAGEALNMRVRLHPRAVITASESLLPNQRTLIRDAFGVEPRIWYGNTEMAGNIVECPAGRLHIREEHSYVELVPANVSGTYRLIATPFANRAFGLIRFDTGDTVSLSQETTCPCGRAGRLVKEVHGRMDDYIIDGDGRLVGRLDHLFKEATGIQQAQIRQEEPGRFSVIAIPLSYDEDTLESAKRSILKEAAKRLAPSTEIDITFSDHLLRTAAGKVPFVLSSSSVKDEIRRRLQI